MPAFNGAYDWDEIPDVLTFQTTTAHKEKTFFGTEKKRGTIEAIDFALERWATAKRTRKIEEMIASLADLSSCCDIWIANKTKKNKKAAKDSTNNTRMLAVQKVKAAIQKSKRYLVIYHHSNFASMEARKVENRYAGRAAPLGGNYKLERDFYTNSNKQHVASASVLHAKVGGSLSDMTQADYDREAARLCQKYNKNFLDMVYLNKMSRSQYLVTIDEGTMYYYDGEHKEITTAGEQMVYAVDRYGNLFCLDLADGVQINHSSLLAGQDVIGAGCLCVRNGSLRWIDNNSGHYRPTYQQLCNTLRVLVDQGLPLDDVMVGVMQEKLVLDSVTNRMETEMEHVWFFAHDVLRASPYLPALSLRRPPPAA
jgi:hypothetical protein